MDNDISNSLLWLANLYCFASNLIWNICPYFTVDDFLQLNHYNNSIMPLRNISTSSQLFIHKSYINNDLFI